jgi:hypothetical protein
MHAHCRERRFEVPTVHVAPPLYHVQKHVGLIRQGAPLIKRRAFLPAIHTWLPLLILSAMNGRAFGHSVPVSFIRDFGAYSRFLFAVPLLVLAENILGPRMAGTASHFIESGYTEVSISIDDFRPNHSLTAGQAPHSRIYSLLVNGCLFRRT